MLLQAIFCYALITSFFVTLTFGAPSDGIQNAVERNEATDLAADLENWMSQLPDDLRKVPLNYLAIPGSHDSFTKDITKDSEVSPDGEDILKKLEFLEIVKAIIANWSKTQAFSVTQQLEAGIRFFDLRICLDSDDQTLYFCHGMYSTDVRSVLKDMAAYLDKHPEEVVILDCQHFYNFSEATHNEVIQLLGDTFGDKLIPYKSSMDSLTLENLTTQKQQVLAIYRDSTQSGQASLWPTDSFPTPWYDTMDTTSLINDLDKGLKSRSSSAGYISQLILTPSVNDIIEHALSSLKQKCAEDFQDERTQWISSQTPGQKGVNVIIADFVDLSDNTFSKTVINLNQKLDVAQLNSVNVFERAKTFFASIRDYIF